MASLQYLGPGRTGGAAFAYAKEYSAQEIDEEPKTGGSTDFAELSGKISYFISIAAANRRQRLGTLLKQPMLLADIGHQGC